MQGSTEDGRLSRVVREAWPQIVAGVVVVLVTAVLASVLESSLPPRLLLVLADLVAVAATLWVFRARVPSGFVDGQPRPRFGSRMRLGAVIAVVVAAAVTVAVFASSEASEVPDSSVAWSTRQITGSW